MKFLRPQSSDWKSDCGGRSTKFNAKHFVINNIGSVWWEPEVAVSYSCSTCTYPEDSPVSSSFDRKTAKHSLSFTAVFHFSLPLALVPCLRRQSKKLHAFSIVKSTIRNVYEIVQSWTREPRGTNLDAIPRWRRFLSAKSVRTMFRDSLELKVRTINQLDVTYHS